MLVNYQGHPTQLPQENDEISTEYPGQVAAVLYNKIPSLQFAAYFNGAIGDVSMHGYKGYFQAIYQTLMEKMNIDWKSASKQQRREFIKNVRRIPKDPSIHAKAMRFAFQQVEELGKVIANYVIEALPHISTAPLTALNAKRKFIFPEAMRIKPIPSRWDLYKGFRAKTQLFQSEFMNRIRIVGLLYGYWLLNGRPLPMLNLRVQGGKYYHQTELQLFQLNDIVWFASPGEPFIMYSDLLSLRVPGKKIFFNCMANDTCGYIFPWSFHVRGGYEQTFSFDMLYGQYLLKTFTSQLNSLFEGNEHKD